MRTRTIVRWRKAALGGVLAASLGVAPAGAQEVTKRVRQATQAASADREAAPAVDTLQAPADARPSRVEVPKPPAEGTDANVQPVAGSPDEYVIQKGDTLWDLSQKFLNNPWYWPKIWSLNPGIENPHWIYPGNKLRLVPGQAGEQAPAQVADAEQPPPEVPVDEPAPPSNLQNDFTASNTPAVDVILPSSREMGRSSQTVSVTGKLAFSPPPLVTVRSSGLVSPEELRHAGSLDASFEERQLLSTYDTAYVRFRGEVPARVGENLVLFRRDGEVRHPITRRKMADKTKTVGVGRVISVTGRMATIQLDQVFEEIERGDLVRPWTQQMVRVAPRPNTQNVRGVIVSPVETGLSTYGEAHEVFIDKGSADGVQEGNTFAVVRRGDGLNVRLVTSSMTAGAQGVSAARVDTPDENIGLLLVVETKDHLSTAIVVKSVRELLAGDEVRMHTSGAGGGGD